MVSSARGGIVVWRRVMGAKAAHDATPPSSFRIKNGMRMRRRRRKGSQVQLSANEVTTLIWNAFRLQLTVRCLILESFHAMRPHQQRSRVLTQYLFSPGYSWAYTSFALGLGKSPEPPRASPGAGPGDRYHVVGICRTQSRAQTLCMYLFSM